jgi:hypothetical protein
MRFLCQQVIGLLSAYGKGYGWRWRRNHEPVLKVKVSNGPAVV